MIFTIEDNSYLAQAFFHFGRRSASKWHVSNVFNAEKLPSFFKILEEFATGTGYILSWRDFTQQHASGMCDAVGIDRFHISILERIAAKPLLRPAAPENSSIPIDLGRLPQLMAYLVHVVNRPDFTGGSNL